MWNKLTGQPEHEHRNKTSKQNINKLNPETFKRITHHKQVDFISGMQDYLNIRIMVNIIHHINRI